MALPLAVNGQSQEADVCIETQEGKIAVVADSLDGVFLGGPYVLGEHDLIITAYFTPADIFAWFPNAWDVVMRDVRALPNDVDIVATDALGTFNHSSLTFLRFRESGRWSPDVILAFRKSPESIPIGTPLSRREAEAIVMNLRNVAQQARWVPPESRSVEMRRPMSMIPEENQVRQMRDARVVYPEFARQDQQEGFVVTRYVINRDGQVDDESVSVICSSHPIFHSAAERGIKTALYQPAFVHGQTVAVTVTQQLNFTLQN